MHVFDTARGIASVFQQRAAHCTLCWLDSSDSSKDEPPAICGQVERSKQFEISDSLGVVFTAQLFVFFVFLLPLVEAFQLDEDRNPYLLIWLPCHCCFLRRPCSDILISQTCFPLRPHHRGKRAEDARSVEGKDRARRGACDSGQAQVLDAGRALEGDHAVQDKHGWRCKLGRVHDVD